MELSEAFDLLEKEVAAIGMIDAWGGPQDPSWGLALVQKTAGQDADDLSTALERGLISPQEYYDYMLPIVRKFRVEYLTARSRKRVANLTQDLPPYRVIPIDEAFKPETLGWESWWDQWWSAVEMWAENQPEPRPKYDF